MSELIKFDRNYETQEQSMFHGETLGFFDSINRRHPKIWEFYKLLKSQDWDENEFDYSVCNQEFKLVPVHIKNKMIKTLIFQWEADSVAAMSVCQLTAPFVKSNDLAAYYVEVTKNEILHSATYSEIVKNSFDNPNEVLATAVADKEALQRVQSVNEVFSDLRLVGSRLTLFGYGENGVTLEEEEDAILMFVVTLFCLERIQFMASFAITFAIADAGMFLPIAKAVQKICNDEFQIHVEGGREIIRNELSLKSGKDTWARIQWKAQRVLMDIVDSEILQAEHLFADGEELPGLTLNMVKEWVYYSSEDVFNTLGLVSPYDRVGANPLKYMEEWIDINSNQASAQEEKVGNYLLGRFMDDSDKKTNIKLTF